MKTRTLKPRIPAFLLIACLIALAAGPASQALADTPDIQFFHVDDTYVAPNMSAFCGFTIIRHTLLDGQFIVRQTASGGEVDLEHAQGTATFSANGKSILARFGRLHLDWYYADGTSRHLGTGEELYIVLPGVGPAWGETGSYSYTLDANGNVIAQRDLQHFLVFSTPAVCTALAP